MYGLIFKSNVNNLFISTQNSIAWGDGTYFGKSEIEAHESYSSENGGIYGSTQGPSHTYAKAGTYYIKGTFYSAGYGQSSTMLSCMIKCLKLACKDYTGSYITRYANEFYNCSKLTHVNLTSLKNNPLTDVSKLFGTCSSLTLDNIVGLDTLNLSKVTNMFGMFANCSNITQLPFTTIPDSVKNIGSIFIGTGITDISGLTIGSDVTSATDWIKDCPITTANNVTIKCSGLEFGNSTLTTCNNLTITSMY